MKLNSRAIITGFGVDFFGSILAQCFAGIFLSGLYAAAMASRGYSGTELIMDSFQNSLINLAAMSAVGLTMTFIGGWTAAGIAEEHKVLHAALGGAIVLSLSLLIHLLSSLVPSGPQSGPETPLAVMVFGYLVQVPLATFGGWARQRHDIQLAEEKGGPSSKPPIPGPFG